MPILARFLFGSAVLKNSIKVQSECKVLCSRRIHGSVKRRGGHSNYIHIHSRSCLWGPSTNVWLNLVSADPSVSHSHQRVSRILLRSIGRFVCWVRDWSLWRCDTCGNVELRRQIWLAKSAKWSSATTGPYIAVATHFGEEEVLFRRSMIVFSLRIYSWLRSECWG